LCFTFSNSHSRFTSKKLCFRAFSYTARVTQLPAPVVRTVDPPAAPPASSNAATSQHIFHDSRQTSPKPSAAKEFFSSPTGSTSTISEASEATMLEEEYSSFDDAESGAQDGR
jgi:hypothetical protein